ncbi:chloramphenicol acetyltransferase [Roseomonas sp. KE2513]|uniref:chloramphenicol acetyltransferase n=1 Tax=Roseomonas sp. KE2513 TaxID=2479202 RepID=UPI0018E05C0E|nr:chloramphenicol acetyltransferase [Roseomonas sp. KE2513]MBI0535047.1 chloramphenicol acetyltransferase [Roseomonas sp. KE2513]
MLEEGQIASGLLLPDPDTADKSLGERPSVHQTAQVRDSRFGRFCEVGAGTRVAESVFGDYSYVARDSDIIYTEMGRFCSIAAGVRINPGNHPLERVALNHFTYRSSAYGLGEDNAAFFDWRRSHRVTLGHDVWIGHGAIILPGVTIGTGAAIGAGAVVSKAVPDFAIVVGVPGRVLRYRFSPEIIAALHRIAWWNWPHERLGEAMHDFRHMSADAFCAKHDPGA